MAKLTLKVNGTSREVESDDPDIPLLYVLRGDLGLTVPLRPDRVKAALAGRS
jgi:aerobic-type carbon monoxide dehydrogenase small subunit (CoxS/CutS family)